VRAGTDTVTWTLATNLENLTLTGATAVNGTGNAADNVLVGNGAANTLQGLAGNDTYDGGAGNDALTDNSTTSNDTYRWGTGCGVDTVSDAGGSADRVEFGAGITAGQPVFAHVGNNLEITISGNASDKLVISNYYVGTANKIETFALSDGSTVPGGVVPLSLINRTFAAISGEPERQAQVLLSAMAAFGAESAASLPDERQTIQPVHRPDPMWVSPALM